MAYMLFSARTKRRKVSDNETSASCADKGNPAEGMLGQDNFRYHATFQEGLKAKVDKFEDKMEAPFNLDLFEKYKLHEPIFADSSNTKFDALVAAMTYSMRHNLSGVAREDLLKMINVILGDDVLPASNFKIENLFSHNADIVYHYYCNQCKTYVGTEKECKDNKIVACPNKEMCKEPFSLDGRNGGNYFITLSMASQLVKLLEEPGMSSKLIDVSKRASEKNCLADIFDGLMYKGYLKSGRIRPEETLTITVDSDGSPVFKACGKSFWPIQFRLNELPPGERFAAHRVLTAGLWFGKGEPVMSTFFVPIIEQAKKLEEEGIKWVDSSTGLRRESKVLTIYCVADSCAKPMLQNMKKFNGYYGCCYCMHPGKSVGRVVKYPAENHAERKDEECREYQALADKAEEHVWGFKGYSPFLALKNFMFPWGMPIDAMHACFLGNQEFLFELWFNTKYRNEPYHLNVAKQELIDKRLLGIRPPSNIVRPPRSIFDRVHWKANEWRPSVFYYTYVCLDGILPDKYLQHYALFCTAIYILYQEKISESELRKADGYLKEFVSKFEMLYGEDNMRFNLHLLTHLARNVAVWGPLWTTSVFDFEAKNGAYVDMVHGTRYVVDQIAVKSTIHGNISTIFHGYDLINPDVDAFCEHLLCFRRLKNCTVCDKATLVGSFIATFPKDEEARALTAYGISDCNYEFLAGWEKIIFNGLVFDCGKGKTHFDDTLVKLDDKTYCRARLFFRNPMKRSELLFFGRPVLLRESESIDDERIVSHIKECRLNAFGGIKVYRVKNIECKSVLMKVDHTHFVCDIPNSFEKD